MLPLSLNLARLRVALIGRGPAAAHRLHWLEEAGARGVTVFASLPESKALSGVQLVFIAGLAEAQRDLAAAAARAAGAIVYVEDAPAVSDIQAPAVLRRGDLVLAISTNGAAPGLAAEMKRFLGGVFGPEWRGRLQEMKALRRRWQDGAIGPEAIRRLTAAHIARNGWLAKGCPKTANDRGKPIHERGGGTCL